MDATALSAIHLRGRTTLLRTVKVVWSWRPDAGAKVLERATRASGVMVAKEPGHQGEREGNR